MPVAGGQRGVAGSGQRGEPVRVDVLRVDGEPVPGRVELHRRRGPGRPRQHLAQPRHLGLERVRRPGGRVVAVQAVNQAARRDHPAGVEQQHQQGAAAGPRRR
ncbi:hypothetical protein GCM10010429_51270 [Micromonospora olivasterospora]